MRLSTVPRSHTRTAILRRSINSPVYITPFFVISPLDMLHFSCAAVTAYNALNGPIPVKGGDVVLVQGTGGVSM